MSLLNSIKDKLKSYICYENPFFEFINFHQPHPIKASSLASCPAIKYNVNELLVKAIIDQLRITKSLRHLLYKWWTDHEFICDLLLTQFIYVQTVYSAYCKCYLMFTISWPTIFTALDYFAAESLIKPKKVQIT